MSAGEPINLKNQAIESVQAAILWLSLQRIAMQNLTTDLQCPAFPFGVFSLNDGLQSYPYNTAASLPRDAL